MVEEYFKNPLLLGLVTFILIYVVLKYAGKSEDSNKKILTKSIIGGVLVGIIGYCIVNYNSAPVPEMLGGAVKNGFELSSEPKKVLLEELMSSTSTIIQGGGIVDEIAAEASSSVSSEILGGSAKILFNHKPLIDGSD
jgi:hypothetical protein